MGCAVSTAIPVHLPAFPEEAQDEEEKRSVEVQLAETGPSAPSPSATAWAGSYHPPGDAKGRHLSCEADVGIRL